MASETVSSLKGSSKNGNRQRRFPSLGVAWELAVSSRTTPASDALVEAVSTGTTSRSVGIVDGEALLLDGVFEVDGRPVEVWHAHLVYYDLNTVEVDGGIAVKQPLIEVELALNLRSYVGGRIDQPTPAYQ